MEHSTDGEFNIYAFSVLLVPNLNKARTTIHLIKSYYVFGEGEEEVGCLRSWPASIPLPHSGEELQTVRESHAAVYLHFSISSHSSLEFPKESGNQY